MLSSLMRNPLPHGGDSILAVDDDPEFLGRLADSLRRRGYKILTAQGAAEAIRILERPDAAVALAIIDLVLPGPHSGFDLIGQLTRQTTSIKIVAVSGIFKESQLYLATRAGAHATLRKPAAWDGAAAEAWLSVIDDLLGNRERTGEARLSARELEVVSLLATGATSRAIAQRLGISAFTVNNHRKHICRKLGVHSTAELVARAVGIARKRALDPPE